MPLWCASLHFCSFLLMVQSTIGHPEAHRKFEWDLRYTDELKPKLEAIKAKTTPERHTLGMECS
jgi:hypothetical protein